MSITVVLAQTLQEIGLYNYTQARQACLWYPKAFKPIVLLNMLGKLIEKMIARQLQFDAVKYSILHPNQLGGVAQWSTEDAGVFLTHLIWASWAKGLKTSVVAFDIA